MTRILVYFLLFGSILYILTWWNRQQNPQADPPDPAAKPRRWFRGKKNPRENWVQVYETASIEEARMLQARLQEEEVECIVYEQGKKDIHGNALIGVGIAVPKSQASFAQSIISRMAV